MWFIERFLITSIVSSIFFLMLAFIVTVIGGKFEKLSNIAIYLFLLSVISSFIHCIFWIWMR